MHYGCDRVSVSDDGTDYLLLCAVHYGCDRVSVSDDGTDYLLLFMALCPGLRREIVASLPGHAQSQPPLPR